MMIGRRFAGMVLICSLLLACVGGWHSSAKAASTVMRVYFYLNQNEVYVDNKPVMLDSPATIVEGKTYVPVKFLGDTFGFPVAYDAETNSTAFTVGTTDVVLDLTTKTALVSGLPQAMDPLFKIINGRTMAQLTWIMDQIGADYSYSSQLSRVEVVYYKDYNAELPTGENSKPIAKFTFGKKSYKMGEKIKYIDLSYDAEGEGIPYTSWKNKQDAFFEPGEHEISLQVTDANGNVSDWFTKSIFIENETLYEYVPFQMLYTNPQSYVKLTQEQIRQQLVDVPVTPVKVRQEEGRKLLVSNSPEEVLKYGILYADELDGKGRLYASHINKMQQDIKFAIVATNRGTKPVTITTTRQGEVYPSVYVNLIGHQASVDFLVGDVSKPEITIMPGQTSAYAALPVLKPGQGINLIYDIETSDELTFTFVAMNPNNSLDDIETYEKLEYNNHIRGTFPVSELYWTGDLSGISGVQKLTIGDGTNDVFVNGYDPFRQGFFQNYGNYGVKYNISLNNPGKKAIVLRARGGGFKGAFKINGEIVLAPVSGVISANDPVFMLGRTDGDEKVLNIEFTPPSGSSFPIDLIFYPLP